MSDDFGYIYCITSNSEPGICKIGCVWKEGRTPIDRLKEANSCTWHIPDFKLNFAKRVKNPREKEEQIHEVLEQFTERVHPAREFFRVKPEKLLCVFRLIDGENWVEVEEPSSEETERGCRTMEKCFRDGQRIRHIIGDDEWIGIYNTKKIIHNGVEYSSLSTFSIRHHQTRDSSRKSSNGWQECECEVDNVWISTRNLPELPPDT